MHHTLLSQNRFRADPHRVGENVDPFRLIVSLLSVNQYSAPCATCHDTGVGLCGQARLTLSCHDDRDA
jgi:hypothetical protein